MNDNDDEDSVVMCNPAATFAHLTSKQILPLTWQSIADVMIKSNNTPRDDFMQMSVRNDMFDFFVNHQTKFCITFVDGAGLIFNEVFSLIFRENVCR